MHRHRWAQDVLSLRCESRCLLCVTSAFVCLVPPLQRGAFDIDATVYPIAIKYNKIFVDAFWNSRKQSFTAHLVRPPGTSIGVYRCCCGVSARWCIPDQVTRKDLSHIESAPHHTRLI